MRYNSLSELFKDVLRGLFFVGIFIWGFTLYFNERADNKRLKNNLTASQHLAEQFTTKDNHLASKKLAQYITPGELKEAFPDVTSGLANLYIKPQRAENYTETRQTMKVNITAPVTLKPIQPIEYPNLSNKDTARARVLIFSDEWITIYAELGTVTGNVQVAAVDSVFTSIYRGARRRPLLWILSKRQLEVAASNRNPYITIEVIQGGLIKH